MHSRIARFSMMTVAALIAAAFTFSCNEDLSRDTAPVLLEVHVTDQLSRLDLRDTECPLVATIEFRNIVKRTTLPGGVTPDLRFLDIQMRSYRVSFIRTDGGTVVPRPFVQSISALIPAGGAATELPNFLVLPASAEREAPFAALDPAAGTGGRDPETGQSIIRMDIIIEFFGETLAGDPVAATVRFPMSFCISCGGCLPKEGA